MPPRDQDGYGPNQLFVDPGVGWAWTHKGGDWIDANGLKQGPAQWFSKATGAAGTPPTEYSVDVTAAVKEVQSEGRWNAMLLTANVQRQVASPLSTTDKPPSILVQYANGDAATLACRILAQRDVGQPLTTAPSISLPAFIEFERPTSPVTSAVMMFTVTLHSGGAGTVKGYLLDPPLNHELVQLGDGTGILGQHDYLDSKQWSDFALTQYHLPSNTINTGAEREFDPAIYGNGPTDTTKLPHLGLGKWINWGPDWQLVKSDYASEGFAPLSPGLGAVRVHMPKSKTKGPDGKLRDATLGDIADYGGGWGAAAYIFMPEPLYGNLGHIFVRFYARIGTPDGGPYRTDPADRLQFWRDTNPPHGQGLWAGRGGKWAIVPEHCTAYGGYSGSSGGGGWQMRQSWSECDAGDGPDNDGWAIGAHLWDFGVFQPPGHNYGAENNSANLFGQKGGLGGMLYAHRWYCVEMELLLNSMDAPGHIDAHGVQHFWKPDGALRTWIDGRLVYERTGMVFRQKPFITGPYNPAIMRPCRELGVRSLCLNWYHGGTDPNCQDRYLFFTGLKWGTQYIGPEGLS